MKTAKKPFSLGRVVATRNSLESVPTHGILSALERHERGDWGDLCPDDRAANDHVTCPPE